MRDTWLSLLVLVSMALCDSCPSGYSQAPNGGDCYQGMSFYDSFNGVYWPKSFDEAEYICNQDGGGLLTSVHSAEEWNGIWNTASCDRHWRNIGLKCRGKDCKWDDGSPVDYTNFAPGKGPQDDNVYACYGVDGNGQWQERGDFHGDPKSCTTQRTDCWICRVKAKTIECVDGEAEYKGGCASVHSTPLDQKSAEASCPGGGHLVSIHGNDENAFYQNLASSAGVTGTVYIGGQFSNGVFEWIDGSYANNNQWANSFPNALFGSCVQMLLASEFGVVGQWTNIDCTVKQAYICFRDGSKYDPPAPNYPLADPKCPSIKYFTGSGSIFSPNFPLSIPPNQSCEYVMSTGEGTRASIKFPSYDCQSGTYLALFDGMNSNQPFMTFTTNAPPDDESYSANSNIMKIVFTANGTEAPIGTGWQADFIGI